ncbi:MAG: putative glycoside hydrolase [Nitrospirota bacterium]
MTKKRIGIFSITCALILLFFWYMKVHGTSDPMPFTSGKVIDFSTGMAIEGATVTLHDRVAKTDKKGMFFFNTVGRKLAVRACGYLRAEMKTSNPSLSRSLTIRLQPFTPKALYLTVYGIGDRRIRSSALKLIEETELNSLVIDVKGDRGIIPYRSSLPAASKIGAQKIITVKDMKALIGSLRERGVYLIARIVVFKDNLLALAKPHLAVQTRDGTVWRDREDLAWADPFRKEVWDYNISIAVEAAQYGFDEIQFDYVRFPDTVGLVFSKPNTEEERVKAISDFLVEAKRRLAPYNVFLDADIFGYVFWNINDTKIGQKLESLIDPVEYLSPMLYPSGFRYGIPGYRKPVAHPYEIVSLTLRNGKERANLPSVRFRPWLQAFRDYAFDRRLFGGREIRDQIKAAEDFGSHGWMLWNPQNTYSADGLKKE